MTLQPTCLINQSACWRIAGQSVCPKCGADEQLRFTTQEAVQLAQAQSSAKYWQNEAAAVAQRSAVAEAERQEMDRLKTEEAKRQAEKERQDAAQQSKTEEAKQQAEVEKQCLPVAQASRNPGQIFQDLPTAPQIVVLLSGSFWMGSESTGWIDKVFGLSETPRHKVTITHKLAMGRYPVTFDEWDACWADGGSNYKPQDQGWGGGFRPVINVSWDDAQAYIAWLNKKLGIAATDPTRYRLPSEAEWEYACRAGSQAKWCFGDDENQLYAYAWYNKNSGGKTQPVGQKKANAFGLYDMHGNVWEWVQDYAHDNYDGSPDDGTAWEVGGARRVLRGGSWGGYGAWNSHSASRWDGSRGKRSYVSGFRLARTLP